MAGFTRRKVSIRKVSKLNPSLPLNKKENKYSLNRENRPDKWNHETIRSFFREGIKWLLEDDPDHLYFEQYCLIHGVFKDDIDRFRGMDKAFDLWHKKCMDTEQVNIAWKGARNKINAVSAMFYLKSKHKWQDTHKVDIGGAVLLKTDIESLTK